MTDLSLATIAALGLRYDGPIPTQHLETDRAAQRRARGTLAVLEIQAARAIDAAIRSDGEADELAADMAECRLAREEWDTEKGQLAVLLAQVDRHVHSAIEALRTATALRRRIGLPLHPVVKLAAALVPPAAPARAEKLS